MRTNDDPAYGSQAQTPAQRTQVLRQMQAANPARYTNVLPEVQALHQRYIAGDLSWKQVQALCYAAEPLPFRCKAVTTPRV